MKRGLKVLAIVAVAACAGFAGDLMANCQDEGPYPIISCGREQWFAPPPAGSGNLSVAWWQLGFGSRPLFDPTGGGAAGPADGDGFVDTPNPGIFIGNDSGNLPVGDAISGGIDLVPATNFFPGAPAGALCFAAAANWALPGVDGCADNNRGYYYLGGAADASDAFLNRYFDATPGVLSDYRQLDSPMGVLLTESNNLNFALAFFATQSRGGDANDLLPGNYDMSAIVNGDMNASTGRNDTVPWQPVPQPSISATFEIPGDSTSNRVLAISWTPVRLVHDNSTRPSGAAGLCGGVGTGPAANLGNCVLGQSADGNTVDGVGVLDQPELVTYIVETSAVDPNGTCGTTWAAQDSVLHPGNSSGITVAPDTCVRLKSAFGRVPTQTFRTATTITARNQNRVDSQAARFGDVGFHVDSAPVVIGGPLVSNRATLKSAVWSDQRRTLKVTFETLAEVGLDGFDVIGIDRKGGERILLSQECAQCSSGIGSTYTVEIPRSEIRSTSSLVVVVNPTGSRSNVLEIDVR